MPNKRDHVNRTFKRVVLVHMHDHVGGPLSYQERVEAGHVLAGDARGVDAGDELDDELDLEEMDRLLKVISKVIV